MEGPNLLTQVSLFPVQCTHHHSHIIKLMHDRHQHIFPFSYDRKYLDIHSMHRLEKTASTEEMREYGGGGEEELALGDS